jgi:hypothetical protein
MSDVQAAARSQTEYLDDFRKQFEEEIESVNEDVRLRHADYIANFQNRYQALQGEKDALMEEKAALAKSIFEQFTEVRDSL